MARICPQCNRVHPEGVVLCEHAQQIFEQRDRRIEHYMMHHPEVSRQEAEAAIWREDNPPHHREQRIGAAVF